MTRNRDHSVVVAAILFGLLTAAPARAASLSQVNRSEWTGGVNLPSYLQMYIYVPDNKASKPPIVVSAHSCGNTASGQFGSVTKTRAAADAQGFILVFPDNPGQNCWDVGSSASLKHDGGGDTQGVALMVKYALSKYGGDPSRVYIFGGSSGGMLTQAMLAVYPDLFRAGSARAGVPAGCWADGYASSNQWSGNCAGGNTTKTAQQWGDLVRSMYPGYTGHRPRVQTMQGESDTTISYKNTAEAIKEWTNVLGLSTNPTSTDTGYKAANATYNRQFWKNVCGYTVFEVWSSPGGTHSMAYEEADILKFFGLDATGGADPEPDCKGDAGVGGAGGASGSGGATGAGGTSGGRDGGPSGRDGGGDVPGSDSGGVQGSGGRSGSGGSRAAGGASGSGSGGSPGSGGSRAEGGASGSGNGGSPGSGGSRAEGGASGSGSGGSPGSGGSSTTTVTSGNGGARGTGGSVQSGGTSARSGSGGESPGETPGRGGAAGQGGATGTASSGCNVGSPAGNSAGTLVGLLLAAIGLVFRRERRARPRS